MTTYTIHENAGQTEYFYTDYKTGMGLLNQIVYATGGSGSYSYPNASVTPTLWTINVTDVDTGNVFRIYEIDKNDSDVLLNLRTYDPSKNLLQTFNGINTKYSDFSQTGELKLFTGDDVVTGNNYRNVLEGGPGNDIVSGLGGNDTLWGDAGMDTLKGGSGNDTLKGSSGTDTAVFSGSISNYTITRNNDYSLTVIDKRSSGDGTDLLESIEYLHFDNGNTPKKTVSEALAASGLSNFSQITGNSTFLNTLPLETMGDEKYIANGSKWDFKSDDNQVITWAIADNGSYKWPSITKYRDKIGSALEEFEKVTNLSFQFVDTYNSLDAADTGGADFIFVADGDMPSYFVALAFFPDETFGGGVNGGRVFKWNPNFINKWESGEWTENYFTFVVLHEVGHSLGLKHPHDNGSQGNPYTVGSEQNGYIAHISAEDTVMSYYTPGGSGTNGWHSTTPMYLDAFYMNNYVYGQPNYTKFQGDTTHTIQSSQTYSLIVERTGNDTIDLSETTDYNTGWHVSLTSQDSDFFEAQLWMPSNFDSSFMQRVKGIGSFENAIGSNYNDKIIGSTVKNIIKSGSGNDVVVSIGGGDDLDGGSGSDTLRLSGLVTDFTINLLEGGGFKFIKGGNLFADAKNFEVFEFKASNQISKPYSSNDLLQFVPNTKATGTVGIQGTPKEDEWLNLSLNITDPDGTNSYTSNWQIKDGSQWITKKSNDDTLQLTQEFVGKEVRVQVTHTDNQGDQTVFVSSSTNAVQNTNDLPTGQLVINGTAKIGETLTLDTSTIQDEDGPTSLSFSYTWHRSSDGDNWTTISNANNSSYTIVDADAHHEIMAKVSYTDAYSQKETVESEVTSKIDPGNGSPQGKPIISSSNSKFEEDATLAVDLTQITDSDVILYEYSWIGWTKKSDPNDQDSSWIWVSSDESNPYSYWLPATKYSNGQLSWDQNHLTYKLSDEDVGEVIGAVYGYYDGKINWEYVFSDPTTIIQNINDSPTGYIYVSGSQIEDETVSVDISNLRDDDGFSSNNNFTFQWQRSSDSGSSWTNIDTGGTNSSYTIGDADVNKLLSVLVSYTDDHGTKETLRSQSTQSIKNKNDETTGNLVITSNGDFKENQTLTVNSNQLNDADGINLNALSYQWQVEGDTTPWQDISGATGTSLLLTDNQVNKFVRVVVAYEDGNNTKEVVISDGKGPIANVNDTPTGRPIITGEWNIGSTLTAETSGLYDEDGIPEYTALYDPFSYQWMKSSNGSSWVSIDQNAKQKNYTLTTSDDDYHIKVNVSFKDLHQTDESIDSLSKLFEHVNKKPTGGATITGNPQEGVTLSAGHNIVDADGITGSIAFEWERSFDSNAKDWDFVGYGSSYSLSDEDIGGYLRVVASYVDNAGTPEKVVSSPTSVIINVNDNPTGQIEIQGDRISGKILTADISSINDQDGLPSGFNDFIDGTLDSDCIAKAQSVASSGKFLINGDKSNGGLVIFNDPQRILISSDGNDQSVTFTIKGIDKNGAFISENVTGSNANQSQTTKYFKSINSISVSQDTASTVKIGVYASVSYQWQRSADNSSWSDITSANGKTYTLTNDDVGNSIRLKLSFIDLHGTTEQLTSTASGTIKTAVHTNTKPSGNVTITGTTTENQTLTINSSNLTDADGLPASNTFTYRWEKSTNKIEWDVIAGATSGTYALSDPEVGHYLRARISYTDQKQTPEVVYSNISNLVKGVNDNPSGTLTIDGKFQFGKILSVNTKSITDPDGIVEFSYQWQRSANNSDWNDINGEIEKTYLLRAQDVGQYVRVVTTYLDYQGTTETLSSTGTEVTSVNKLPTGNVTITGNLQEGSTLTINTSNLADENGLGTLEYQWQRSEDGVTWQAIEGVYSSTYQLDDIDIGSSIRAKVFYKDNMGYFETVFSNTVTGFVAIDDEPVGGITVKGDIYQHQFLNADVSHLSDPDGLGALEYQWQRSSTQSNFTDIGAATDQTYQLTQEDVNQYVRVVVRYKDGQGFRESLISNIQGKIINVNDKPTGEFTISGTASEDKILVADVSQIKDLDGLGTFHYSWEYSADGKTWSTYKNENNSSLILDDKHVGYHFRSLVEYTDQSGFFEQIYSDSKGPVTAVNDKATGSISVSGMYVVGQTLRIKPTMIQDVDGVNFFIYKWYQSDNGTSNWVLISSSESASYALTDAVKGKYLKAELSFVDKQGFTESFSIIHPKKILGSVSERSAENVITGTDQNEQLIGADTDDDIIAGGGDDTISSGGGSDVIDGGAGNDVIFLEADGLWPASYRAFRVAFDDQGNSYIAENKRIHDQNRFYDVIDGNADTDTIVLTNDYRGDAFFLHDFFGTFNDKFEAEKVTDAKGNTGVSRISNIERVIGRKGDDVLDITSTDFVFQNIELQGNDGNDYLWGNDGNDILDGGEGLDILAGGRGNDQFIIRFGEGSSSYDLSDVIRDFTIGTDKFSLANNLSFSDLKIETIASGKHKGKIGIAHKTIYENYAVLDNLSASDLNSLSSSSFQTYAKDEYILVTGTLEDGSTLTLNTSNIKTKPSLAPLNVTWEAQTPSGDWIILETGQSTSFTLTQDHVGYLIRANASFVDEYGVARNLLSHTTQTIVNKNDNPTGSITFSSKPIVSKTIVVDLSKIEDKDDLGEISLQWQSSTDNSNWSNISDQTSNQFEVTNNYFGKYLRIKASYTDKEGTAETVYGGFADPVHGYYNQAIHFPKQDDLSIADIPINADLKRANSFTLDFNFTYDSSLKNSSFSNKNTISKITLTPTNPSGSSFDIIIKDTMMDIGFEGWLASSGMGVSGYANQQDTYTLQNGNYNCVIELKKVGDAQSVVCVLSSVGSNGVLTDVGFTTANLYLSSIQNADDFDLYVDGSKESGVATFSNFKLKTTKTQDPTKVFDGSENDDTMYGTPNADLMNGYEGDDIIRGLSGDDTINGGKGNDYIVGDQGDDTLSGNEGDDTILGQAGKDSISSGTGNDVVYGSLGDDLITVDGTGGKTIVGGGGTDSLTISHSGVTSLSDFTSLHLDYAGGSKGNTSGTLNGWNNKVYKLTHANGDIITFSGIETFKVGSNAVNLCEPKTDNGNSQVMWVAATNSAYLFTSGNTSSGSLNTPTRYSDQTWFQNNVTWDKTKPFNLIGTSGVDQISSNYARDTNYGGHQGAYVWNLGNGNDSVSIRTIAADSIDLGAGNDWMHIYALSGQAINAHSLTKLDGGAGVDTLDFGMSGYGEVGATITLTTRGATNFENLGGTAVKETLQGNSSDNIIFGGDGADTIYGNDGNDTLLGKGYRDAAMKAQGYEYSDGQDDNANNILYGGLGNDILATGNGSDTLDGGKGSDRIYSGTGNDLIILRAGDGGASLSDADIIDNTVSKYSGFTDGQDTFGLADGLKFSDLTIAQGTGDYAADTIISVTATSEYLAIVQKISASDITIADMSSTASGDQTLNGTSGNDTILGAMGVDTITTGTGNDVVYGSLGDDLITVDGTGGKTIVGGGGTDSLTISHSGVTSLSDFTSLHLDYAGGSKGNTSGTLNGWNNKVYKLTHANGDIITFSGIETFKVGSNAVNLCEPKTDNGNSQVMWVAATNSAYLFTSGNTSSGSLNTPTRYSDQTWFQNNVTWDKTKPFNLIGTSGVDQISSNYARDTNYGGHQGAYVWNLGNGNDSVSIRTIAADSIDLGAGNDWMHIYALSGQAINAHSLTKLDGGAGVDTLDFGMSGYGEVGATITLTTRGATNFENLGGTAVKETLQGNSSDNIIFGGDGADTIYGNDGNDTLLGKGYRDAAMKAQGYEYSDGQDDNANNILYGGLGNDILATGNGSDTLDGGKGSDRIYSGTGNDLIILRAGDGGASLSDADIIDNTVSKYSGFTDGQDTFGLADGLKFSDLTIAQGTGDYAADTIISVTATSEYLAIVQKISASDITIADMSSTASGDQTLNGTSGNDTILGAMGVDTITTGTGNDVVYGSLGDDLITVDGTGGKTIVGGGGTDSLTISHSGVTSLSDFTSLHLDYAGGSKGNTSGTLNGWNNKVYKLTHANGDIITFSGIETFKVGSNAVNLCEPKTDNGNSQVMWVAATNSAYLFTSGNTSSGSLNTPTRYSDQTWFQNNVTWDKTKPFNLIGTSGVDQISSNYARDTNYGGHQGAYVWNLGNGNDSVSIRTIAADSIDLGAGNDWMHIYALSGQAINAHSLTKLDGGAGVDTLDFGMSGYGEVGATITLTTRGATNFENLGGTAVKETLQGNSSDNIIFGGDGADTIYGNDGNDTLLGKGYRDAAMKAQGYEYSDGQDDNANNILYGGLGNDILATGNGSDTLDGGKGSDRIYSGTGNDLIILRAGDGGASLSDADIIDNTVSKYSGFTDGQDTFGLADGLKFSDLTIAQGTGDYAADTIISVTATSEYLAIVQRMDFSQITETDMAVI